MTSQIKVILTNRVNPRSYVEMNLTGLSGSILIYINSPGRTAHIKSQYTPFDEPAWVEYEYIRLNISSTSCAYGSGLQPNSTVVTLAFELGVHDENHSVPGEWTGLSCI